MAVMRRILLGLALASFSASTPASAMISCGKAIAGPFVESDFHVTEFMLVDWTVPGEFGKVVRVLDNTHADNESSENFIAFVRRYPRFCGSLGIVVRDWGKSTYIIYPSANGINRRLRRAGFTPLRIWEDPSKTLTPQIVLLRRLAERGDIVIMADAVDVGNLPEFSDGRRRNVHFHDMFLHFIGWLLIPPEILEISRWRAQVLFELYDDPLLAQNAGLRERLEKSIREESERLDTFSNLLLRAVVGDADRANAVIALKRFASPPLFYLGDARNHYPLSSEENARIAKIAAHWKDRDREAERIRVRALKAYDWNFENWVKSGAR